MRRPSSFAEEPHPGRRGSVVGCLSIHLGHCRKQLLLCAVQQEMVAPPEIRQRWNDSLWSHAIALRLFQRAYKRVKSALLGFRQSPHRQLSGTKLGNYSEASHKSPCERERL